MNKLVIFIGLVVLGALIAGGPVAYNLIVSKMAKSNPTLSVPKQIDTVPMMVQKNLLSSPKDIKKINKGINQLGDLFDFGSKVVGFIVGTVGLFKLGEHTNNKRKVKKLDKKVK